jgi:hypothetical protein
MLFKQRFWAGLADGSVTVAFRRWRRPTVRAGGRLRVPTGVLAIDAVNRVAIEAISEGDARRAGFGSRAALIEELEARPDGELYRIDFHYAGPDEREALRSVDALTDDDVAGLKRRLARLDAAGEHGAWTMSVLRLIAERPGTRAAEVAMCVGRETQAFKTDVRKLKELGLTESLDTGYDLSPRGRALLRRAE